jgi:hypothetical protein
VRKACGAPTRALNARAVRSAQKKPKASTAGFAVSHNEADPFALARRGFIPLTPTAAKYAARAKFAQKK